jgi:hypothetical protein
MKQLWCTWWVGVFLCGVVFGQHGDQQPVFTTPVEYPVAISFFAPLFLPKILQDEYRLKEYICGEEFASFRRTYGDLSAVDAIFDRALRLSWNNIFEALLLSFVCTIEHRNFGVRLPLVGPLLWLPLTSEFPDQFQQRVLALPSNLYIDSPPDLAGDRDKLQHFFGSALIAYTFESCEASQRVGMFVEWGEDKFVVEGSLDQRDMRANGQGQDFGDRLLVDASVLPSGFLREQEQVSIEERGCMAGELQNATSVMAEER